MFMERSPKSVRGSQKKSSSKSTRIGARRSRRQQTHCEPLEDRRLLSAAVLAAVPSVIDPNSGDQALFAPDSSESLIPVAGTGQQKFFRFAVDSVDAVEATFKLIPTGGAAGDAAIAIYDSSGGRLAVADADATPGEPGAESVDITLVNGKVFTVGVFFGAAGPGGDFKLDVTTSPQTINPGLAINPVTGAQVPRPVSPEDGFDTPRDVDYYPLTLTNGGATGNVTVTPTGLDVKVSATLFRRATDADPWTPIASAADPGGAAVSLNLTPPAGQSITDAQYLLAVAPVNFTGGASSYGVALSNVTLATPGALPSQAGAVQLGTLGPTGVGTVGASRDDSIASAGEAKLFQFKSPSAGTVTIQTTSAAIGPAVSVYDSTGQSLLAVATRTQPGATTLSFSATAGTQYVLRVADAGGTRTGTFNFRLSAESAATTVALNAPVTNLGDVSVAGGGQIFRVQPDAAVDVLVIEATPRPGTAALVTVAGSNGAPVTAQAAAGARILLPVNISNQGGPFDVFVSAVSGADPVRLRIGQLVIPKTLPASQLSTGKLNLNGTLSSAAPTQPAGAFGAATGVAYYALPSASPADASTLRATGANASIPLVAEYEDNGGGFALKNFALPTGASATLPATTAGKVLRAVVGVSLALDGGGTTTYSVTGQPLAGVGVSMVTDPLPRNPQPGQNPPPLQPPFTSKLNIDGVAIQNSFDQDLFRTELPRNLAPSPGMTVLFTPKTGGFTAKVSVLGPDGQTVLATGTNGVGQPLSLNIPDATATGLANQRVFFRIEPQTLTDGGSYQLQMQVTTTDPNPFLLTETQFPATTLTPIFQNQFGDGSIVGSFNPGGAVSTAFYSIWSITPGPIDIKTIDIDPTVNTDIKLYKLHYNSGHAVDGFVEISDVPLSIDWQPGDRSQLDSRVHVNDSDLLKYSGAAGDDSPYGTGGGRYVLAVRNQEGSFGQYRIEVDTPSFPNISGRGNFTTYQQATTGQTTYLLKAGDSATLQEGFLNQNPPVYDYLSYFPVQLPADNHGKLRLDSSGNSQYFYNVYDEQGNAISGEPVFAAHQVVDFDVPAGSRTVWVAAETNNARNFLLLQPFTIGVSTPANPPSDLLPEPIFNYVGPSPVITRTDPDGDATQQGADDRRVHDTLTSNGQQKAYLVREAAGSLKIHLSPDDLADPSLQFSVYVDGILTTFNQTQTRTGAGGALELVPGADTLDLLLPEFRSPTPTPDFATDQAPKHQVIVLVKSAGDATHGGNFTLSVESDATAPIADQSVALDSSTASSSVSASVTGAQWVKVYVPSGASNSRITLNLTVPNDEPAGGTAIRYDVFDSDGALVAGGTAVTSSVTPRQQPRARVNIPVSAEGRAYYFRIGVAADPLNRQVNATFIATFPAVGFTLPGGVQAVVPPPNFGIGFQGDVLDRLAPTPDGKATYSVTGSPDPAHPDVVVSVAFWVQNAGIATFTEDTLLNADNTAIAIYRGGAAGIEFPSYFATLVDYVNGSSGDPAHLTLRSYVEPGMYVLKVYRSGTTGPTSAKVNVSLPAYTPKELIVDPSTGFNALPNLWGAESTAGFLGNIPTGTIESYRTDFYHIVTPAGSRGALSATVVDLADGPTFQDPTGNAFFVVLRPDAQGGFTQFGDQPTNFNPQPDFINTSAGITVPTAVPGQDFFLALHRNGLFDKVAVGGNFTVPQSGSPDLEVDTIQLSPDNGQTRVQVTVRNLGFGPATFSHSRYAITDTSQNPAVVTLANLNELPLGPFGSRVHVFTWIPLRPEDSVSYTADADNSVAETDESNNTSSVQLLTVDKFRPIVELSLADPALNGEHDPNTFGRYISGVEGVKTDVILKVIDGDDLLLPAGQTDRFNGILNFPVFSPPLQVDRATGINYEVGNAATFKITDVDFGKFRQTTPGNPNKITATVRDRFGLVNEPLVYTVDVVPRPDWLQALGTGASTLTYDKEKKVYKLDYINNVVKFTKTVNEIFDTDSFPFIGEKKNTGLAQIEVPADVTFDPTKPLAPQIKANVKLIVLDDKTIFDKTFTEISKDHVSLAGQVEINPHTLDFSNFNVTFGLDKLPLADYKSPKIKLFSAGISGVGSVDASLQFSIAAKLSAKLTLAINPDITNHVVDVVAPTFIEPILEAGLTVSGDVEVAGFDAASLEGTLKLKLSAAFGLDTPLGQLVDVEDFPDNSDFEFAASISGSIKAKVFGYTVYTFDTPSLDIPLSGDHKVTGSGLHGPGPAIILAGPTAQVESGPILPAGSTPVGVIDSDASPSLVIDQASGDAFYAQTIDSDPDPNKTLDNLAVAQRHNGVWTALTPFAGSNHVNSPTLALTHDGAGARAAVAYLENRNAGTPNTMTRDAFLGGQEIRYRYYDGNSWSTAQALTNDSNADLSPSISFNSTGAGVLAWVHNTSPTPTGADGVFDREKNEIQTAVWNKTTHTFSTPFTISADNVADGMPAAYADENGKLYIVWLRDTGNGGNAPFFSVFNGTTWSAPAALAIQGLPSNAKFNDVAIGSQAPGRIDVLFSVTSLLDDGSNDSRVVDRVSTLAGFADSTGVTTIARDATFSHLRVGPQLNGGLIAYWQQSDGISNEIYLAHTGVPGSPGASNWSIPTPLTADQRIESAPAVQQDTDGSYLALYQTRAAPPASQLVLPGAPKLAAASAAADVPVAGNAATSNVVAAPDIVFSRAMFFPFEDSAPVGSTETAFAEIQNIGLKSDQVRIDYLRLNGANPPTVLGSDTVALAPGATYQVSHAFPVPAGATTYAFRVTSLSGGDQFSGTPNISSATISGKPDVEGTIVTFSDATPSGGQTITANVHVVNNGGQAVGPFTVTLFEGDPRLDTPPRKVGDQQVQLFAGASQDVPFQYTTPTGGGLITLYAVVDSDNQIDEASEGNNSAIGTLSIFGDAHVTDADVEPTVLNLSGSQNVRVRATIHNTGDATLTNVPVQLFTALDDAPFAAGPTQSIPSLAPGASATIDFIVSGLAGRNQYRVVVDPGSTLVELDRTDNVAQAEVTLQGLADLHFRNDEFTINPAAPVQGQPAFVQATVVNNGIAAAPAFRVTIYAHQGILSFNPLTDTATVVGSIEVNGLAALQSKSLVIPIDTSSLLGLVTFAAVIDPAQNVVESQVADNVAFARATVQSATSTAVLNRQLFYNNSRFDGNRAAADDGDDAAIAIDKAALLPGKTASFANISNFSRGINGVAIDLVNLPAGNLAASDFTFLIGATSDPAQFTAAPAPVSVTRRSGAGFGGSDRVEIIWADGAIVNRWLQVTLKAGARSGLTADDVFYFGNLVGETGDAPATASVTASDLVRTRNAIGSIAGIDNPFDFNHSGVVDAADLVLDRNAVGRSLPPLIAPATLVGGRIAVSRPSGNLFSQSLIRFDSAADDALADLDGEGDAA